MYGTTVDTVILLDDSSVRLVHCDELPVTVPKVCPQPKELRTAFLFFVGANLQHRHAESRR
jgi:hypothetical protein